MLSYRPKHPTEVHVWAEISRHGTTYIVVFDGIMTATCYGQIIKEALVPFVNRFFLRVTV